MIKKESIERIYSRNNYRKYIFFSKPNIYITFTIELKK